MKKMVGFNGPPKGWPGLRLACLGGEEERSWECLGSSKAIDTMLWGLEFTEKVMETPGGF